MGILDRIFGSNKKHETENEVVEQAVIIQFNYGLDSMDPLYKLCDQLEKEIDIQSLGEFDGHEIAVDLSDGFLYMYGPNAENLFKGVKSILKNSNFMENATATLRFGPPEDGVPEITIKVLE